MILEELYNFYGSWAEMTRKLELGSTTYIGWRKKGYIPYPSQCVIEKKTHGKLKANINHGKPAMIA